MKSLYKNAMLSYVNECYNETCSLVELVEVYKDIGRERGIDLRFVKKRVEKFCRENGKSVNEIEVGGSVLKVKGFYKF